MNVQELATIAKHALPVKIFLLNNHGHSMIRQTQDQWLDSNYFGSSIEGGLGFPDFVKLAEAYGIPAIEIHKNSAIDLTLSRVLEPRDLCYAMWKSDLNIRLHHKLNLAVRSRIASLY